MGLGTASRSPLDSYNPTMARAFDVCIRGAGITGRALALLLARERLRVGLVCDPESPRLPHPTDVRAYALNHASRSVLESLRCWPDPHQATAVLEMQVAGDAGGELRFNAHAQGVEALTWIVDVPALEVRLTEALSYQPQIEILNAPEVATLTVVCEGRASASRLAYGVEFDVTAYPQHALAARLRTSVPHGQVARQWFTEQGVLGCLPLGGPQGEELAIVWSVSPELAQQLRLASPEDFATQLQAASHGAYGTLHLSSERMVWPLQLARAQRWTGRNEDGVWALAGDAAHTVHPLAGQGLNLGLADVAELARVLRQRDYWRRVDDPLLLRSYERSRKADVLAMGASTDGLQQLFARPGAAWRKLRNWGLNGFDHSGPLKTWLAQRAINAS